MTATTSLVDPESSEALEALEDFVIETINTMAQQAVEQFNEYSAAGPLKLKVAAFVPLPDGSYVAADKATPEQWKQATESAAKDCARQLQAAINLVLAASFYCSPRPVRSKPLCAAHDERAVEKESTDDDRT